MWGDVATGVAGGIGEGWNGRGSMKFLLLLPLGMIVLSLVRASLMKGAVKTWVTCKYSNKFGGFSPWGHCLGCRSSICLQSWVIWVRCHNIPQYPIASFSLKLHPLLTCRCGRVPVNAPAASSLNCSESLFCRSSVKLEGVLHPAQLWRYWSASPGRSQTCSCWARSHTRRQ